MKFSAFDNFLTELKQGARLCVMPVPRLNLSAMIDGFEGFVFYPASTLDLDELRTVSVPADELARTIAKGSGVVQVEGSELEWLKSASTRLTVADFQKHALVAFTFPVNWDRFLSGDHVYHCALLREMSEYAEAAMDLLRFDFCRLHLPDTLPGRAGTFGFGSPYSGALFYTLQDHESYIVGGQVVTHHLVAGLGLEVSCPPSTTRIGTAETGNVARHGLALLSAAMESNSLTGKFIQCMSLLEFLAFPPDFRSSKDNYVMKKVKRAIAAHVADTQPAYQAVLADIERLTHFKDADGRQTGLRTCIVHNGHRFESLVPDKGDQVATFERLEMYIGKTLSDLIALSDEPWHAVEAFRDGFKPSK